MKLEIEIKDNISREEAEKLLDIAQILETGDVLVKDEKLALDVYIAAAKAGATKAYGKIGELLEDENPKKAVLYYKKGAGLGDTYSMVQLGCWLEENGQLEDAKYCYEKASGDDNPEAMYRLAVLLSDEEEKLSLLRKAKDAGYLYAFRALGEIFERKENENLALFWYRQGFERGDALLEERIVYLEQKNEGETDVVIEYDDEETM